MSNLEGSLKSHLAAHLPRVCIPAVFLFLGELPTLANGKRDETALAIMMADAHQASDEPEPPQGEREQQIAQAFAEILQCEAPISRQSDFFSLGGNSLSAIRLISFLRERLTLTIGFEMVYAHPTPQALAVALAMKSSHCLTGIRMEGTGDPFILAHSGYGIIHEEKGLADHLPDLPIFGLENPFFGSADDTRSLAELAGEYAQVLAARFRDRPVVLGGWSFGGLVALEMARELMAMGRQVTGVLMLDSYHPQSFAWNQVQASHLTAMLPRVESSDQNRLPSLETELNQALSRMKTHVPRLPSCPVKLLCAESPLPLGLESLKKSLSANGWAGLLAREDIFKIPGNHFQLFEPPHMDAVATVLHQALLACQRKDRVAP